MTLMRRAAKAPKDAVLLVDAAIFPQTFGVMRTRAVPIGIEIVVADLAGIDSPDACCARSPVAATSSASSSRHPEAGGQLPERAALQALTDAAHEAKALVTACADLLALTLVVPPAQWGADIAVGTSQRFGVPMAAAPTPATCASAPAWSARCPAASSA